MQGLKCQPVLDKHNKENQGKDTYTQENHSMLKQIKSLKTKPDVQNIF